MASMAVAAIQAPASDIAVRAALLAARVSGLVLIAPVFSARVVPMSVRTALVLLLTMLLFPVVGTTTSAPTLTVATALGEALIGLIIGLGAALLIGAAETAGEYISFQIGLSGAALLDPLTQQQSTVLSTFFQLTAAALLLSLDGHLMMLDALVASLERLPLGGQLAAGPGLAAAVASGGVLFAFGLQFAAPLIAVAIVANVALAVLSRAAPQLNILQLAFPVQILIGLAALVAALPMLATRVLGWEADYGVMITQVLGALGGGR